eukprot:4105322-Lingulodinium_polyedra.AAC.1
MVKKSPGQRGEGIRVMLESARPGSVEHAALLFAQTVGDDSMPLLDKVRLLWFTAQVDALLIVWSLDPGWATHL